MSPDVSPFLIAQALFARAENLSVPSPTTQSAAIARLNDVVSHLHLETTLWQTTWVGWLVLAGGLFGGILFGKVAQSLFRNMNKRLRERKHFLRATLFSAAAWPSYLTLFTVGLAIGIAPLAMSEAVRHFSFALVRFLHILSFGWFLYNLVDFIEAALLHFTSKTATPLDDQLVPLVRKTLRLFLVVVFGLFTAENVFGADISAWLAGLGIAGLAVSLAAQESIKNLFGSITIFLDRPYVVGERIVFDGHDGPVEEIGFRSTKLRTLTGELVTIPNSKIVDGSVRNVDRRPNIRRIMDITIPYDTAPEKVEEAVQIVRDILADVEIAKAFDMEKFAPRCAFDALNSDSLNIKVVYWFQPVDYWAYLDHAQQINLRLLRAFADAGIDFAFPTRTLQLTGDAKRELSLRIANPMGPHLAEEEVA